VGWWRFNNQSGENSTFFKDWSSWGNNGCCIGTECPVLVPGKFGTGLVFDGSDDYVNSGSIASGTSGTVEAWIKPNSYNGTQYVLGGLSSDGADINARYSIFVHNIDSCPSEDWGIVIANGETAQTICSGQTYNELNFSSVDWSYISVKYDSSNVNFYSDGELIKTVTQSVSGAGNEQPFSIGRSGACPNSHFNGSIDEVRIYNRALSSEEINSSYNVTINKLFGNFTNLENGIYTYQAYAQDFSGNINQTETRNVTIDITSAYINISVFQAKDMIDAGGIFILDVRTVEEYDSEHIRCTALIPIEYLDDKLNDIPRDRKILVFGGTDNRSTLASEILIQNEFIQVYNILGGIEAWISAGYETESISDNWP